MLKLLTGIATQYFREATQVRVVTEMSIGWDELPAEVRAAILRSGLESEETPLAVDERSRPQEAIHVQVVDKLPAQVSETAGNLASRDDAPGFDQFFREHYRTIRQRVYAVGFDIELADEVTQKAMIIALRSWERVSAMDSPVAYVTTVAINILRRVRRKEAAQWRTEAAKAYLDHGSTATPTGFEDALTTRLTLEQALRVIPQEQAECFVLHHMFQCKIHEVAGQLGISEGTAKSRVHAACLKLRGFLGTTGGLQ